MSDHNTPSHESHSIRGYLFVYFALLAGTAFTVWASFIHFGSREINIAVALVIACVKAFLVAGYFMHLISERAMLFGILLLCAFFFVVLMLLPVVTVQTTVGVH